MHTPPDTALLLTKCTETKNKKPRTNLRRGFSYIFLTIYIITVLPGINISFAYRITSYKISSPICCDQISFLICRGQRYNKFYQLINSQRKQNRKSYRKQFIFCELTRRAVCRGLIKRESRINRKPIRETQNTPVAFKTT